jgi:hypothetical protein
MSRRDGTLCLKKGLEMKYQLLQVSNKGYNVTVGLVGEGTLKQIDLRP